MANPILRRVLLRLHRAAAAVDGAAFRFFHRDEAPKRLLATVLVFAVCGAGLVTYHRKQFTMLYYAEAVDNAQIARNIAEGKGFTTSFIRPSSLALNDSLERHPELRRPPLGPFVEALFFALSEANDRIASYYSCFFYLLTLMITWRLASLLFGWQVAALSTLALGFNQSFLSAAISGMPLTLAAFLFMVLCHQLWFHYRRHNPEALAQLDETPKVPRPFDRARHGLWVGVLTGLCCLTYYVFLAIVPATLIYVASSHPARRKWLPCLTFLLGFVVCFGPLLARNWRVTGTPGLGVATLELSMFTEHYPGYTLHRQFVVAGPTGLSFVLVHPKAMLRKAVREALTLYPSVSNVPTAVLLGLFLVSLFYERGVGRAFLPLRRFACWAGALAGAAVCAVHTNPHLLVVSIPLVAVAAIELLLHLCRENAIGLAAWRWRVPPDWMASAIACVVLSAAAFPSVSALCLGQPRSPNPFLASFDFVASHCAPTSALMTDVPWSVGWYSDRPAVWLAMRPSDLGDIPWTGAGQRWLYLSKLLPTYPPREATGWLQVFVEHSALPDAGAPQPTPTGGVLYQLR